MAGLRTRRVKLAGLERRREGREEGRGHPGFKEGLVKAHSITDCNDGDFRRLYPLHAAARRIVPAAAQSCIRQKQCDAPARHFGRGSQPCREGLRRLGFSDAVARLMGIW